MSDERKSEFWKYWTKFYADLVKAFTRLAGVLASILALLIIFQIGVALFGDRFEASNADLKKTEKARADISNALFLIYNDFGRLEVRSDHSVHAYIQKKDYMSVPYPDRSNVISFVGKEWCKNKGVNHWYLPKVVLRDIQTGEILDSCYCLWNKSK